MIGSTAGVQIWVATTPVDMRQGFDRLSARVREHLGHNPLGGHLFVFRNRSAERVKILWWDGSGLVLYYNKLESHYPHLFPFTGIGGKADNFARWPTAAVGMD